MHSCFLFVLCKNDLGSRKFGLLPRTIEMKKKSKCLRFANAGDSVFHCLTELLIPPPPAPRRGSSILPAQGRDFGAAAIGSPTLMPQVRAMPFHCADLRRTPPPSPGLWPWAAAISAAVPPGSAHSPSPFPPRTLCLTCKHQRARGRGQRRGRLVPGLREDPGTAKVAGGLRGWSEGALHWGPTKPSLGSTAHCRGGQNGGGAKAVGRS